MYCTNCGVLVEERDVYCSQCGVATGRSPIRTSTGPERRLMRSMYDSKIAGVCGGLAHYMGVDPTLVRLMWLVCTVCFPPLVIGYIAAWIIVPKEAPQLISPLQDGIPQPQ